MTIRREVGAHFEVRLHPHVVVKQPRHVGTPDEIGRLVVIQQSLADIDGVPWAIYDEPSGVIVEERGPGDTLRRLNTRITGEQRKHVRRREREVLDLIEERGLILRDRTPSNVLFDPETSTVTVIDFVEVYRVGEKRQAWRQP